MFFLLLLSLRMLIYFFNFPNLKNKYIFILDLIGLHLNISFYCVLFKDFLLNVLNIVIVEHKKIRTSEFVAKYLLYLIIDL